MNLQDGEDVISLIPTTDTRQCWLAIGKNGYQVGNPDLSIEDIDELLSLLEHLKALIDSHDQQSGIFGPFGPMNNPLREPPNE